MLKFALQYPEMQHNLIDTVIGINTNIISINQSRHAFTPKLAVTIITKHDKSKKYKIHYSKLLHVVHPTVALPPPTPILTLIMTLPKENGNINQIGPINIDHEIHLIHTDRTLFFFRELTALLICATCSSRFPGGKWNLCTPGWEPVCWGGAVMPSVHPLCL